MNQRGWEDLVDLIDQKYGLDTHKKHTEPMPENPRLERTIDAVWFEKQGDRYKIERITQPAVTGTKSHYAHRGVASHVEHTYDEEETVSKVVFYKESSSGSWQEVTPDGLLN